MQNLKVERTLMIIGIIAALASIAIHYNEGWRSYAWQIGCFFWILTNWLKTDEINKLTKNK